MNRILVISITAALVTASVTSAVASEGDGYFASADVGQAKYRFGRSATEGYHEDGSDITGAVRFGYRWRGPLNLGVETGYVDLGKQHSSYSLGDYSFRDDLSASGWMFGFNGSYRFDEPWYVSVRGGLLHSVLNHDYSYQNLPYGPDVGASGYGSDSGSGAGWYAGIGGGYDFDERLSLGLHYDNYHVKTNSHYSSISGNISALTMQVEYRF